jgi:D-hydroxyproline dehydrogenase subunit alpha
MPGCDVIVVGGGPAGMAAAVGVAAHGLIVELIEQRHTLGGAIFRQPVDAANAIPQAAAAKARWQRLSSAFSRSAVKVRHGGVFFGVDGDGLVLFEDRTADEVVRLQARAVIIAVGAVEKVRPVPGWELPGVSTVGGLQVMMKETGRAPKGRVLLAGNGPLLMATAAQMAGAGNPPVAIIEAGDPLRQGLAGLGLLVAPQVVAEALGYLRTVYAARIPWLRGARVECIETQADGLQATVVHAGRRSVYRVDRIGLHDGIRSNDLGLPANADAPAASPVIVRAGDCAQPLGAVAAEADGAFAARKVTELLGCGQVGGPEHAILARRRQVQAVLARLFARVAPPLDLPNHTVLCRCEGRTLGDLKHLIAGVDAKTGREIKHAGRFAMGTCQGRFCAANVAELMNELRTDAPPVTAQDLTGQRWPLRPVSIAALVAAAKPKPADG